MPSPIQGSSAVPAAFGNIALVLRPGGRLVLLVWQTRRPTSGHRALVRRRR
jgi:hypothetical protein